MATEAAITTQAINERRACRGLCGCDGSISCPCMCHDTYPEVCQPVALTTERTVYGTRIGAHWAFVVASYGDLLRFAGETTTAEYPCEACGQDQMRLERGRYNVDPLAWMVCRCGKDYPVAEMPARQCNGQGE